MDRLGACSSSGACIPAPWNSTGIWAVPTTWDWLLAELLSLRHGSRWGLQWPPWLITSVPQEPSSILTHSRFFELWPNFSGEPVASLSPIANYMPMLCSKTVVASRYLATYSLLTECKNVDEKYSACERSSPSMKFCSFL